MTQTDVEVGGDKGARANTMVPEQARAFAVASPVQATADLSVKSLKLFESAA